MKKVVWVFEGILAAVSGVACLPVLAAMSPVPAVTQYVDPMIGCAKDGHTYPGPTCPFGLVQPGPDSGNGDWAHCSGYVNADDRIFGFSQTHLSGTGCPDFGDLRLLPFMDRVADDAGEDELYALKDLSGRKSGERADGGSYRVDLADLNVRISIAAGRRVAFYRFAPTGSGKFHLLVDPQWGQLWLGRRIEDHILSYSDRLDEDRQGLRGSFRHKGWLDRTVHFKIRFDRPFSRLRKLPSKGGEKASRYVLDFEDASNSRGIEAMIALSFGSPEGAERNFAAEAPMGFEGAQRACVAAWEKALSVVDVSGATRAQRISFYTSLYHLMLQPNLVTDVDEAPRYSTFSLWDTFRAAHPLYTILVPDRAAEFANSLLAGYRRNGFLPVWEGGGDDNFCMIGNHAVPVVADAVLKGFPGVDRALAYEAVTNSLTVTHRRADGQKKPKEDWDVLDRYGYYPFDLIEGEGVSRTLECAYDDACAARLAKLTGDRAGEAFFAHRAGNWTNVLDRSIGLVRGKDSRGRWRDPFDPFRFGGGGDWDQYDCTEGNAWQYTWHVLHDPQGLIAALGGRDGFLTKLDELFVKPQEKDGWAVAHMTGRIGQYVQGNEPSHHIPYLYALAGRPDRTAEIVREVCDRFYLPKVDGLCGNDDCGQMSAWYVFACLGFYPLDPCGGEYVLGAPQVPMALVKVGGEGGQRTFKVLAKGLSKENRYVKSVTLNGKPITDWKIRHADIMNGGELEFEMCRKDEPGRFVPLFNGVDLSGWAGAVSNGHFRVDADGCLVCVQNGDWKTRPLNIWTEREYTNFVFRFEFLPSRNVNNGVGIRAPEGEYVTSSGMEIQMLEDESTDYYQVERPLKPYQYNCSLYGVLPAKRQSARKGYLRPFGEWNEEEIRADGSHLTVTLNGETVLDADLSQIDTDGGTPDGKIHPGLRRTSGHISWCWHDGQVKYRSIRILEL